MAGYSTTPLVKKLGLSEGARVRFIHAPEEYESWLTPMPAVRRTRKPPYDFVHLFVNTVEELEDLLPELRNAIDDDGMIWVSWYKKSSGKMSGLTEDIIRDTALALGLVDVKVCAVSDEWSGLKLVIRTVLRDKKS